MAGAGCSVLNCCKSYHSPRPPQGVVPRRQRQARLRGLRPGVTSHSAALSSVLPSREVIPGRDLSTGLAAGLSLTFSHFVSLSLRSFLQSAGRIGRKRQSSGISHRWRTDHPPTGTRQNLGRKTTNVAAIHGTGRMRSTRLFSCPKFRLALRVLASTPNRPLPGMPLAFVLVGEGGELTARPTFAVDAVQLRLVALHY